MSNPLRWLALVPLEHAELPDPEKLKQTLTEKFPEAENFEIGGTTEQLITGTFGDFTVAVTLAPTPIPWSQLEGPCATAWYWPEAVEQLRDHQAHLLVTLVDEGGKAIEKSTMLTQLTAAALVNSPALGVFWGPGRLVHPPNGFLGQAEQMTPQDLPLFLWVDFRVERVNDRDVRLYTTGLEALGQTELEAACFSGTPQELLEHAYNIAHYLICGDKSVEDTHTIGLTDELQAMVYRGPSFLGGELEVLQLEFEALAG